MLMLSNGRHRLIATLVLVLTAGSLLAEFPVRGEFATFSAETENPGSAFAGGWVDAPTGLSASPAGYGASFSWTPGTQGVTGQELWGVDGGTGGSASCGTYALAATMPDATTAAYTDPNTSAANGHWWCYRMISTSGTAWTTSSDFAPLRVGLYPVSVALSGNGNGKLQNGEQIVITFNQDISPVTIGKGVCQVKGTGSGELVIGFTGACGSGTAATIGTVTGLTVNKKGTTSASASVTGSTVTITATSGGQKMSGTGTFTASASVTSATGGAQACTTSSAPACTLSVTAGF